MWRLLICNLKGRRAYNFIIICAVALALTEALSAAIMTQDVRKSLMEKQMLLGPELALVPVGTKQTGHIYLTKGPPSGMIPAAAAQTAQGFPEIKQVSVQKVVGTIQNNGEVVPVIVFDPVTDFMVLPWLATPPARSATPQMFVGCEAMKDKRVGDSVQFADKTVQIVGRLQRSGSFMDKSVFFSGGHDPLEPVSWVLLGLQPNVSVDMMVNKLETNIDGIEVIARPEMLKTINSQLQGVVEGGSLHSAATLVAIGAFLIAGSMFSLLIYERRREMGLLKAMGARNSFVFSLIVGESVALSGIGAVLGIAISFVWLTVTGTPLWSGEFTAENCINFVLGRILLPFVIAVGIAVVTALLPALWTARMEPYAAIRSGE